METETGAQAWNRTKDAQFFKLPLYQLSYSCMNGAGTWILTIVPHRKPGARGETRTRTPFSATPSRWCVYQFRHPGRVYVVAEARFELAISSV